MSPKGGVKPTVMLCGVDIGTTNSALVIGKMVKGRPPTTADLLKLAIGGDGEFNVSCKEASDVSVIIPRNFKPKQRLPFDRSFVGLTMPPNLMPESGEVVVTFHAYKAVIYQNIQTDPKDLTVQGSDGREYPVMNVFRIFLHHFARRFRTIYEKKYNGLDFRFALTVPATAGVIQERFMADLFLEAMQKEGLDQLTNETPFTIPEPTAGVMFALQQLAESKKESPLIAPGRHLLVLDVGGGTTDMTSIRIDGVNPLEFGDVTTANGFALGGADFDQVLVEHIQYILGDLLDEQPSIRFDILNQLVSMKNSTQSGEYPEFNILLNVDSIEDRRLLDGAVDRIQNLDNEDAYMASQIPGAFAILDQSANEITSEMDLEKAIDGGEDLILRISSEFVNHVMQDLCDRIIERVEKSYKRTVRDAGAIHGVICFGGFMSSPALAQAVSSWVKTKPNPRETGGDSKGRLCSLIPGQPSLCVVNGSAYHLAAQIAAAPADDATDVETGSASGDVDDSAEDESDAEGADIPVVYNAKARKFANTIGLLLYRDPEEGMGERVKTKEIDDAELVTNICAVIDLAGETKGGDLATPIYEQGDLHLQPGATRFRFQFYAFRDPDDDEPADPTQDTKKYRYLEDAFNRTKNSGPAPCATFSYEVPDDERDETFRIYVTRKNGMTVSIANDISGAFHEIGSNSIEKIRPRDPSH